MLRQIVQTSDGSSTIYIEQMDETYHSSHGAIQEAKHVFIQHGIQFLNQECIKVFEMGFGTGLNALLTAQFAQASNCKVEYHGIEAFPVEEELLNGLNYEEKLGGEMLFKEMHALEWNALAAMNAHFLLHKIHARIEEYTPESNSFDLVFYDAFGPSAQGTMWELEVLTKMHSALKVGGVFVTYCAQGQFKRHLKALGFEVEALPGPPGKREMTRAIKR